MLISSTGQPNYKMIWFSTYDNTFRHVVTGILGATVEGQLDTTNDHTNDCASQRWGRHCRCHVQLGMVVTVMGAIMMVKVVMEVMMVKVLLKMTLPCQWRRCHDEQHRETRHSRQKWFSQLRHLNLFLLGMKCFTFLMLIKIFTQKTQTCF